MWNVVLIVSELNPGPYKKCPKLSVKLQMYVWQENFVVK